MRRTRRCATTLRPLAAPHLARHPTRSRWMKCWRTSEALKQSTDRSRVEQSRPFECGWRLKPGPKTKVWRKAGRRSQSVLACLLLHPLEPHPLAVREPGGDVAAGEAGLALRHLLLRAAQRLPPRRPVGRARQRRVDDLLDLLEAQHDFGELLFFQIIAQRVVVVHGRPRLRSNSKPSCRSRGNGRSRQPIVNLLTHRCRHLSRKQRFRAHPEGSGANDAIWTA